MWITKGKRGQIRAEPVENPVRREAKVETITFL